MKPLYLEPDEEITSVIDKISSFSDRQIALVVPKNSGIFQSLINLKLLAKEAKKQDKDLAIIGASKTGARLAEQVGLRAFASLGAFGSGPKKGAEPPAPADSKPEVVADELLPDGIKVNRYQPPKSGGTDDVPEEITAPAVEEPEIIDSKPEAAEDTPSEDSPSSFTSAPIGNAKIDHEPVPSELLPHVPVVAEAAKESGDLADRKDTHALPPIVARGFQSHTELEIPWRSIALAAGLLVVLFFLLFLFLPRATVTVNFPATTIDTTVSFSAATAPGDANTIASNLLTSEQTTTKTVTATGKKDIGSKAAGSVSIKNCEDTTAHTLASGSKLTASSKNFLTTAAVSIPAGSFSNGGANCNSTAVSVNVTAEQSGDTYNVSGATFTISGLSGHFTATGTTTGGSTKQVTVLSQDDADKALAELKQQATDQATADLKTKAANQTLLDKASWSTVKTQSIDKKVGDQVDSATATFTAEFEALVFDQAQADQKLKELASKDIAEDHQLIIPDDKAPALNVTSINDAKTALNLESHVEGFSVKRVDTAAIAKAIKHRSQKSAQAILTDRFGANGADIHLAPNWWFGYLPLFSSQISVDYGVSEAPPSP